MGNPIREIIRTPDFQYAMLYYPEIVARLRRLNRVFAPEITNEDPREPFIQLERAFALMAHYNAVLMDVVANESYIETARMPASVKELLKLINYRMLPSSPAIADILVELTRTYPAAATVIESNRKFATRRTALTEEIVYENLEAVEITNPTDEVTYVYGVQSIADGTCDLSSTYPDIVEWSTGDPFVAGHLDCTLNIATSVLGNVVEELTIVELLDWDAGIPGYRRLRVAGASFVEEAGVEFTIYNTTANLAPNLNASIVQDPFATNPYLNDRLYVGHSDVMWDRMDFVIDAATVLGSKFVWEFYDDSETVFHPSLVTHAAPFLTFQLDTLLGTTDATGAVVEITFVSTGAKINTYAGFVGSHNIARVLSSFGQATPSTVVTDYVVSAKWRPVDIISDTTLGGLSTMGVSGYISMTLPQTTDDRWNLFTLHEQSVPGDRTGYFLRARCTNVGAFPPPASGPVLEHIEIHNGKQYMMFDVTQGSTVEDDPLGSSDGTANQEFLLTRKPYVLNSARVFVDEGGGLVEWTYKSTLTRSYAFERHFTMDMLVDGSAKLIFGDGVNGKIPIAGANNIVVSYRIGADDDGNVGPGMINVNRDGVGAFKTVTNPRSARFWQEADWASMESLERVKERGPQMLRTMFRAVTAKDCEVLATSYVTSGGTRPVERAFAIEESFGPKTVEIVVVGNGGSALSSNDKSLLAEYFNGGETYDGALVLNHEATITNYTPRSIAVTCIVTAYSVVTSVSVRNLLLRLLSPTAMEDDGQSYVWRFGQTVPTVRIAAEIFRMSPGNVFNVTFTSPSADVLLGPKELPMYDDSSSSISVVEPSF